MVGRKSSTTSSGKASGPAAASKNEKAKASGEGTASKVSNKDIDDELVPSSLSSKPKPLEERGDGMVEERLACEDVDHKNDLSVDRANKLEAKEEFISTASSSTSSTTSISHKENKTDDEVSTSNIKDVKNQETKQQKKENQQNHHEEQQQTDHNQEEEEEEDDDGTPDGTTKNNKDTDEDQEDEQDGDEEEDHWEITGFIPFDKLKASPFICDARNEDEEKENCKNFACLVVTSEDNPKKYRYCIDCWIEDFEVWPSPKELAEKANTTSLDPRHLQFMEQKCSKKRKPSMPSFKSSGKGTNSSVGKNKTNMVTPTNNSLASVKGSTVSQVTTAPKLSSNKTLMDAHKRWEKDMEAAGGKGLTLIINTNEAKKVVYDMLKDAYRPMNFNDIYHFFKGSIPKVSGSKIIVMSLISQPYKS